MSSKRINLLGRRSATLFLIGVFLLILFCPVPVSAQEEPPVEPQPTPETGEDSPLPPGEFPPPPSPDRLSTPRSGTRRYVSGAYGNDTGNDCTVNTDPCATIAYAVSQAVDDDIISIASGTYNENITGITKALVFEGSGMNETFVNGGGVNSVFTCTSGKSLEFIDITITNGSGSSTAGGIHTTGPLTLMRVTVTGNSTNTVTGGGIYVTNTADFEDVDIKNNQSNLIGGGLSINLAAGLTATLERVTFSGNTVNNTLYYGGGLYVSGAETSAVYLTNSTFSGNSAAMGSALAVADGATLYLDSVTVAENTGSELTTGAVLNYGNMNFINTIVADNLPHNCTDSGNSWTSQGYNLDSGTTCGFSSTGDLSSTDPDLGALADNGGYTPTHALPQTSPAVDTGYSSCPAYDQRGKMRMADGDKDEIFECDRGAYEYRFPTTTSYNSHYPNPSNPGQPVKVTVTMGSDYLNVRGTVQIRGASTNCDITLSNGTGFCNVIFNTSGAKTITATYLGDTSNDGSSKSVSHEVRTLTTRYFYSLASQDGYILEYSETSGLGGIVNSTFAAIKVGDATQDRQYRSIVSFDTSTLPDEAVITSVEMKLRRSSFTGTDPFTTHGNFWVDMKTGSFSDNSVLQLNDFKAAPSKSLAGKILNTPVSGVYTMTLPSANLTYLNKAGLTQFRFRFNLDDNDDGGDDIVNFFSGNHTTADYKPRLIVKYYE